jgi:hypothetical protein
VAIRWRGQVGPGQVRSDLRRSRACRGFEGVRGLEEVVVKVRCGGVEDVEDVAARSMTMEEGS